MKFFVVKGLTSDSTDCEVVSVHDGLKSAEASRGARPYHFVVESLTPAEVGATVKVKGRTVCVEVTEPYASLSVGHVPPFKPGDRVYFPLRVNGRLYRYSREPAVVVSTVSTVLTGIVRETLSLRDPRYPQGVIEVHLDEVVSEEAGAYLPVASPEILAAAAAESTEATQALVRRGGLWMFAPGYEALGLHLVDCGLCTDRDLCNDALDILWSRQS